MRILLVVDCYLPSTKSSAKMMHDLAVEFHRQGHEVIIAAPDDALARPSQVTTIDGVTVLRIRTGLIKGAPKIIRAINEMRLSSVIWKAAKSFFSVKRCDLIVFYSPSIFFGSLVRKLKRLWNCRTYLILRDIFPQWAIDTGVLKNSGLICRFFRAVERRQYTVSDVIGVQSPANLRYFSEYRFKDKYKIEVLYNWTTLSEKNIAQKNYREHLGLQDKVLFFYGGNIGVAQDMDNIVRLAKSLDDHPTIYFLLVGDGTEVPRLKEYIQQNGLNNISILPSVPQDEYLAMLSQVDVGLISLDPNLKTHNFPGKMLGYMYFSIPILAGINAGNDLRQILEGSKAGLVCLNGEDEKLHDYALKLAKDMSFRRQTGQDARTLLEKTFSVTRAASQILSHMKNP